MSLFQQNCYTSGQHLKELTSTAFQMLAECESHCELTEHGKHPHTCEKNGTDDTGVAIFPSY